MRQGTNVSSGIESEVESSVGDIDKVLGDGLSLGNVGERVDELGGSELESDLLLRRVGVDGDDSGGLLDLSSLEESETDTSGSEDGDGGVLCETKGKKGAVRKGRTKEGRRRVEGERTDSGSLGSSSVTVKTMRGDSEVRHAVETKQIWGKTHPVVIPQPKRQAFSRGAFSLILTTETSATTVY